MPKEAKKGLAFSHHVYFSPNKENITARTATAKEASKKHNSEVKNKNKLCFRKLENYQRPGSSVTSGRKPCHIAPNLQPIVNFFEDLAKNQPNSPEHSNCFLPPRVLQLRDETYILDQIETPLGVLNIPEHTPVKIERKKSKQKTLEGQNKVKIEQLNSAIGVSNETTYASDIIKFYEIKEYEIKKRTRNSNQYIIPTDRRKCAVYDIIVLSVKLALPSFLAYHAVKIMDDAFATGKLLNISISLLASTSLWLVIKKDHVYDKIPSIEKIIKHSGLKFTKKDLFDCERQVLKVLKFNISYPDPTSIIIYNLMIHLKHIEDLKLKFGNFYYIGAYMLDIVLFNIELMKKSPLLLASVITSFCIIIHDGNINDLITEKIMKWMSKYPINAFSDTKRIEVEENLKLGINNTFCSDNKEYILYEKYRLSRYGKISDKLEKKFM